MSKTKKQTKGIMIVLLAVLIVVGIVLCVRAAKAETKTVGVLDYQIGALDANGEYVKDTSSMVTRKFLSVEDMDITLAKDAMVTYKVFFFDKHEEFISADKDANTGDYAGTVPSGAAYFKVVVTPTNDAEVDFNEINNYARQITITYGK